MDIFDCCFLKLFVYVIVCVCVAALSEDDKLAMRCSDVLLESLSLFPHQVQVWLCSLYAILQLVSANSKYP